MGKYTFTQSRQISNGRPRVGWGDTSIYICTYVRSEADTLYFY